MSRELNTTIRQTRVFLSPDLQGATSSLRELTRVTTKSTILTATPCIHTKSLTLISSKWVNKQKKTNTRTRSRRWGSSNHIWNWTFLSHVRLVKPSLVASSVSQRKPLISHWQAHLKRILRLSDLLLSFVSKRNSGPTYKEELTILSVQCLLAKTHSIQMLRGRTFRKFMTSAICTCETFMRCIQTWESIASWFASACNCFVILPHTQTSQKSSLTARKSFSLIQTLQGSNNRTMISSCSRTSRPVAWRLISTSTWLRSRPK